MLRGTITQELNDAILEYEKKFPGEFISLFEVTLNTDRLVARIKRAIAEGLPYDPIEEEWDEKEREDYKNGKILL